MEKPVFLLRWNPISPKYSTMHIYKFKNPTSTLDCVSQNLGRMGLVLKKAKKVWAPDIFVKMKNHFFLRNEATSRMTTPSGWPYTFG